MVASIATLKRIAIVDDDLEHRKFLTLQARLAGYEPMPVEHQVPRIEDLVGQLRSSQVEGALCDHRLQEGNYAGFFGAAAVAALYDLSMPAILVTDYVDLDINIVIRQFRKRIPTLIRGSELRPDTIRRGFDACVREVQLHEIPLPRRPRRAFVHVDEIEDSPKGKQLTVFVPRWREHEAVALPEAMIPEPLRAQLKKGRLLIASINTEAERSEDLFFEDFEIVPAEDLKDEPT